MEFAVREMSKVDNAVWTEMRAALWPDGAREWHAADILADLSDPDC